MKKNDFSIKEFYDQKDTLNEQRGFFGELFHGFVRAVASLFNINLDQNAYLLKLKKEIKF